MREDISWAQSKPLKLDFSRRFKNVFETKTGLILDSKLNLDRQVKTKVRNLPWVHEVSSRVSPDYLSFIEIEVCVHQNFFSSSSSIWVLPPELQNIHHVYRRGMKSVNPGNLQLKSFLCQNFIILPLRMTKVLHHHYPLLTLPLKSLLPSVPPGNTVIPALYSLCVA